MKRTELPGDHLSDYERAICYYTLPRVTNPVTFGLVVAYFLCVFEAAAALCLGIAIQSEVWTRSGAVALAAIVIFGVIVFMIRALMNEVNRRKALAVAHGVPDAPAETPEAPDPFADHRLIRRPSYVKGSGFVCTDRKGTVLYTVDTTSPHAGWKVTDAQGKEVLRVRTLGGARSFSIDRGSPGRFTVHVDDDEVARIARRFTFAASTMEIDCVRPDPKKYVVRQQGIYHEKRLVGRIYSLRNYLYLDIEEAELNEAILGLFIATS